MFKIGLGLGLEFVERPEIRAMKKEIEDKLNEEWIAHLKGFLKGYSEKIEQIDQERVSGEIVGLGEKTRSAQISSTLLKILSKIGFDLVKLVIVIIFASIITVATIWAIVSFDLTINTMLGIVLGEALWLFINSLLIRKNIKDYMFVRSNFYELAEKPSLEKAENIMKELEKKSIIYA